MHEIARISLWNVCRVMLTVCSDSSIMLARNYVLMHVFLGYNLHSAESFQRLLLVVIIGNKMISTLNLL